MGDQDLQLRETLGRALVIDAKNCGPQTSGVHFQFHNHELFENFQCN